MNGLATDTLSANETVIHLTSRLSEEGYWVTRSFDLQIAREEMRDPKECPCPHHGSAACTCQYVVLLVNRAGGAPATLVVHGHDDRTLVSMERSADRPLPKELEETISTLLSELTAASQSTRHHQVSGLDDR